MWGLEYLRTVTCTLSLFLAISLALHTTPGRAQTIDQTTIDQWNEDFEEQARERVLEFVNEKFPEFVELKYLEQSGTDKSTMALQYDWNSNKGWTDEIEATSYGLNFGGSGYNTLAKGSYAFSDDYDNTENSQVGIEYQWRWFPVRFERATLEDGQRVQQCMLDATDSDEDLAAFGGADVDTCRSRLGLDRVDLSYNYIDVDFHAKVEGDQQFDQRNYLYGFELSYSRNLGRQRLLLNPIVTIGLEQVDPKNDMKREAVLADDALYNRAYGEFGVTSGGLALFGQALKLSYSWRYYRELSPDEAIEAAGLDRFRYSAVALQVPTTLLPWFQGEQNNFIITYASGSLPLSLADEETISIGWRSELDLQALLGLQ